jgi:hypothetical protein
VVSTDPAAPLLQQGQDPLYAAAFMTAALGRLPRVEAGAWVWDHVQADARLPLRTDRGVLDACVAAAAGRPGHSGRSSPVRATMKAPLCVGLQALAKP